MPGGIGSDAADEDSQEVSLLITSMETLSVWMCEYPYWSGAMTRQVISK